MYSDEFKHQLPDIDPSETTDWIASFDDLVDQEGLNGLLAKDVQQLLR